MAERGIVASMLRSECKWGLGGSERIVPHDVVVLEFLQETDLSDGGARYAFVFCLETNLLERYNLFRVHISSLVDDTVCS